MDPVTETMQLVGMGCLVMFVAFVLGDMIAEAWQEWQRRRRARRLGQ